MNTFIGIDPGINGGIAVLGRDMEVIGLHEMPETEREIWDLFANLKCLDGGIALIERVHAFPKQGVVSVWTFASNYAGVRMALVGNGIPFYEIAPFDWQREMDIKPRKDTESKYEFKKRLKAKAENLFPAQSINLKTADALLIAEKLRRDER